MLPRPNWLHVDIFRFFFAKLGEYYLNSSKWVGKFPEVLNLNWLFLKPLTGSSATTGGFSPVIGWDAFMARCIILI
jgi:hypothetical protein